VFTFVYNLKLIFQTAYALDCGGCTRSRSSMLLSTNEEARLILISYTGCTYS